ncbi:MAG: hypothetical protein ABIQ86_10295 [Steroidobacteraceae bacterium]
MDDSPAATTVAVDPRHISYAHVMYALHAATIVIGIVSAAMIVTAFVFGLPSIIAVIMNYVRRPQVRGTWLDSHFSWQLRTFWIAAAAFIGVSLLFGPLVLILIGIPLLVVSYLLIGIWVAYRVARGWLALKDGRSMPVKGF